MKKNLCIVITSIMMLSLVGCGPLQNILSNNSFDITTGADSEADDDDVEIVENEAANENNHVNLNDHDDEKKDDKDDYTTSNPGSRETIKETVLYDADDIKITAKNLSFDDDWYAATIDILIENNSDTDLNFITANVYVNGYHTDAWLYADVNAGKKSNETLCFYEDDFERCGITTIAEMEFAFEAYDMDTYDDYLETELIKLETSAADGFEYEYNIDGTVLFDDDDIQVLLHDFIPADPANYRDAQVLIYFYNGSDDIMYLSTEDASVNGYMIYVYGSCSLDPGKHAIMPLTIYEYELDENDIDEITDIEVTFELRNYESYDVIAEIGPVSITP